MAHQSNPVFLVYVMRCLISIHRVFLLKTEIKTRGTTTVAERFKGAWWYSDCHSANPNGLYLGGATDQYATAITWYPWQGHYYSMKKDGDKDSKKK